jgi:hypothetical protein
VRSEGEVSEGDRWGGEGWESGCCGEGDRFRIKSITGSWVESRLIAAQLSVRYPRLRVGLALRNPLLRVQN